jgi:serine/threonine protein kinase
MGRFDEAQTWRLITDLLSALSAAHRASILHLDVKPSNVLLDGNGGFVLTDFGVSHSSRMSKGLLHQGQIAVGLGTHGYRAPEQDSCTIQSFDLRTDLWGVGATAWSLYTGIDLNKRQDVLRRKESGNVFGLQRLSDVALRCPPPLEEVIMDLLYIDPTLRPGGSSEVLTQVKAIAAGFGLDSGTMAGVHRSNVDPSEIREVIDSLVDPLWASICRSPGFDRFFVRFEDGEVLSSNGDRAHHTLLLLKGRVRVERNDRLIDIETREGSLLGAISTLTGAERTVSLRADGSVWGCIFNEAELEQLVTCNPSVAVRLIRNMAGRIADGPSRHRD